METPQKFGHEVKRSFELRVKHDLGNQKTGHLFNLIPCVGIYQPINDARWSVT